MSSCVAASFCSNRRMLMLLGALGLCVVSGVSADTTTLTMAGPTTGTSNAPVTMLFPIERSGDLGYAAIVNYHTADFTAQAGTDYIAASGSIMLPAGVASGTIPVTLSPNTGSGASRQLLMFADSAVGVGPTPAFAAQQLFATDTHPYSVATADINGDGVPDLIVANQGANSVSVLLDATLPGAVTPAFAAQQAFATGNNPVSVSAVDVNGDRAPDLIVANLSDNTVSVLLNTTAPGAATASFAAQQTFATGSGPASVIAADVNGDGEPDLIVANYLGDSVSVLLNTAVPGAAVPSFAAQQTFATGPDPVSVITSDVDSDGMPDLVAVQLGGSVISVLLNTTVAGETTPSFDTREIFAAGLDPYAVVAADVNSDGKPDLIVANEGANTVSVLLNTTEPGAAAMFAPQQEFAAGNNPVSVAAVDVNNDGKPDLVVANQGADTISVLLNITAPGAAPGFATQQVFAAGDNPVSVTAADVNGDGKRDLIVANFGGATVSVLLNITAPSAVVPGFASQQTFPVPFPHSITAADVNGDGKPDLVATNTFSRTVSVLLDTTAPGSTTPSFAERQAFFTDDNPWSTKTADVNGDGKPDLIVANIGHQTVSVLLNTTAPGAAAPDFAAEQSFDTGPAPYSLAIADVNGDGKPDLIVANRDSASVSVLLNATAPGAVASSFAAQQTYATGPSPYSVTAADVNGDRKPDLIVANNDSATVSVLLNATAPGAVVSSFVVQQTYATGPAPSSVTAADVNGDGKPDLIAANENDPTVSVLLNTAMPGAATPGFATQQTFFTGYNPSCVTVADVNGDGKSDLIVGNHGSAVSILLNTTAPGAAIPSFAAQQSFATGLGPSSVVATDVNADGKPDLIVANPFDNTVSVLLDKQYQVIVPSHPSIGTIVRDYIFADGFDS